MYTIYIQGSQIKGDVMETFVNENARNLWKIFEATGNVFVYMLYNAVQHPEKVAYRLSENKNQTQENDLQREI